MFIRKFNAPEGFGLRLGIEIRRKNDGFWARNPKLGKIWEIGKYREYRYYRYWYRENTEIPVSRKKPISPIPIYKTAVVHRRIGGTVYRPFYFAWANK